MKGNQRIEDRDQINCSQHNQKIMMFSLETGKKLDDRLLCETCLEMIDEPRKFLNWSKVKQALQRNNSENKLQFQEERKKAQQLLIKFKSNFDEFKTKFVQTLDEIITFTTLWISNLDQIDIAKDYDYKQYFLEELARIGSLNPENLIFDSNTKVQAYNQMGQCNNYFWRQLQSSLQKLLSFDYLTKLKDIIIRQEQQSEYQLEKQKGELCRSLQQSLQDIGNYIIFSNEAFQDVIKKRDLQNIEPQKVKKVKQNSPCTISYELLDEKKQKEQCYAVAFNKDGTIMASTRDNKIKLGKKYYLFSKKINWVVASGYGKVIHCWIETDQEWVPQFKLIHEDTVFQILLNRNEDQLISCSADKSINFWKLDCNRFELDYQYSLDKHTDFVYGIGLNESETQLVSCCYDKSIIIWSKGSFQNWQFKYYVSECAEDYGFRISFVNNNMIAWQQYHHGIIHIFQEQDGVFQERSDLKIVLDETGNDSTCFFPLVYNITKQVLISKHNKYVYIIKQQSDGKFNVSASPIDCNNNYNFGGLTDGGQHLVIWNLSTKQLRLYRINYQ